MTNLLILTLFVSFKLTKSVPCNVFPKIFGGTAGNSKLMQIDVFGDYLAMAGDTWDNTLAGYTFSLYVPYVAMM